MAEVKTPAVEAVHVIGEPIEPGSFTVSEPDSDGEQYFRYACPCGCGSKGPILVGNGFKPAGDVPSWKWNGSLSSPSLEPSVHHVGHWHGYLTNGVWKSC